MLSKNDKKWLEEMIAAKVEAKIKEALTVKVRFERRRNTESGQPLAVPEIEVRDVYLPAHWVEFLPFHEAALRGVQETTDKAKNNTIKSIAAVEAMAGIMFGVENSIKQIGKLAGIAVKRIENNNPILIEENANGKSISNHIHSVI
jgi:hypothetical protein